MRLLVSLRFAPHSETPRLAARHGQRVVEADADWFESFGPGAFLLGGRGAQLQDGHGGTPVGEVVITAAHGAWWTADCVVESDDPKVLARIRPGQPISLGFDDVASNDNHNNHVRQHTVARLKHIAILKRGQVAAYPGAKITSVVEAKLNAVPAAASTATKSGADWRTSVPSGWEALRSNGYQPTEGDELLLGHSRTASHRFTGGRFVSLAAQRAA
jgi:hypothetical protein